MIRRQWRIWGEQRGLWLEHLGFAGCSGVQIGGAGLCLCEHQAGPALP